MEGSNLTNSGMESIVLDEAYNKHLEKYSSNSSIYSYNYRILGDATGEMGPFWRNKYSQSTWFADDAYFIDSTYPWFHRGGGNSDYAPAGQFYFARDTGGVTADYGGSDNFGARLVLNP